MTEPTSQPTDLRSAKAQRVDTRRVNPILGPTGVSTIEQDLAIARTVAMLMDSQFQIGPIKFGLDSIIGLIPVAGDAVAFAIGMYPVHLARKHRLGGLVIGRMMFNLGADFITGVVPVVGDALDVFFKANLKNVELLEKAAAKRMR